MHHLKRMRQRHFQIVECLLLNMSVKEIAKHIGRTPQSVSICINSPVVQGELTRRRVALDQSSNEKISSTLDEARSVIEGAAKQAATKHVELLDDGDPNVAQRSANAILDRAGLTSRQQKENGGRIVIEADVVNLLNLAASESLA